jgi:hypothetical protein
LGSGLGGLDWDTQVRPLMEDLLDPLPIDVFIHLYEPNDRFAQPRDEDKLSMWLAGTPQTITYVRFFEDVVRLVQQHGLWETLDDGSTFNAGYDSSERRITLSADGVGAAILSESTLSDLWHYLRAAGYTLPGQLPSGMDAYASWVVAVLSRLDYVRPVHLARSGSPRQIGLHLIPPLEEAAPTAKVLQP